MTKEEFSTLAKIEIAVLQDELDIAIKAYNNVLVDLPARFRLSTINPIATEAGVFYNLMGHSAALDPGTINLADSAILKIYSGEMIVGENADGLLPIFTKEYMAVQMEIGSEMCIAWADGNIRPAISQQFSYSIRRTFIDFCLAQQNRL